MVLQLTVSQYSFVLYSAARSMVSHDLLISESVIDDSASFTSNIPHIFLLEIVWMRKWKMGVRKFDRVLDFSTVFMHLYWLLLLQVSCDGRKPWFKPPNFSHNVHDALHGLSHRLRIVFRKLRMSFQLIGSQRRGTLRV